MKFTAELILKKLGVFFFLLAVILLTHASILSFNLMYPEQPSIYLVNQTIHHFSDLVHIYLHPVLLNQNIPFFRPSGHFLLYQLLTPYFGWHNTRAFFIVNFIFLALIGYFFIEIYQLLFPRYKWGAYAAFSLYLMHPALSLARITLMHFEFAYVCFLMFSFYLFIIFCQKNKKFQSMGWFFLSLLFYITAVTFKEPSLMLGPVMMCYFWIYFYDKQKLTHYFLQMTTSPRAWLVMTGLTLVSALSALYIIASWPHLNYAARVFSFYKTIGAVNSFFIDVWGLNHNLINCGKLAFSDLAWRTIIFPYSARLMWWGFTLLSFINVFFLFGKKRGVSVIEQFSFHYQKSFIFLMTAALFFLILPFAWATGGPWHYTPALIFITLIMGFSIEHLCQNLRKTWVFNLCFLTVVLNIFLTLYVNEINIKKYDEVEDGKIGLAVNRNAIFHPPYIKHHLTPHSLIVVEDSMIHNDYLMGNGAYPFLLFLGNNDYDKIQEKQSRFFLKFDAKYSGTLFRYAYLMPSLKEQLYPFKVEEMSSVPNEIIYNWLKHDKDIFCLGYDALGNWHDKTAFFKQQLMKEKAERKIIIKNYSSTHTVFKPKTYLYTELLPYPDEKLCEYRCDQNKICSGFIYQYTQVHQHSLMQCYFYKIAEFSKNESCADCIWYKKNIES